MLGWQVWTSNLPHVVLRMKPRASWVLGAGSALLAQVEPGATPFLCSSLPLSCPHLSPLWNSSLTCEIQL